MCIRDRHNIILALRAHNLMFRDKDYVVNMQNEIASVQEHIEECETYKAVSYTHLDVYKRQA